VVNRTAEEMNEFWRATFAMAVTIAVGVAVYLLIGYLMTIE
jgi:hypothetical protein